MSERYAVIRYSVPSPPLADGTEAPPWESLSSAMFGNIGDARAFAATLDLAQVFELVPRTGLIGTKVPPQSGY